MLHISGTSHNETKISGEFWDFDHLYFAIAYLTGDFGIHPGYPSAFIPDIILTRN